MNNEDLKKVIKRLEELRLEVSGELGSGQARLTTWIFEFIIKDFNEIFGGQVFIND
jgi:hypothetical protein